MQATLNFPFFTQLVKFFLVFRIGDEDFFVFSDKRARELTQSRKIFSAKFHRVI